MTSQQKLKALLYGTGRNSLVRRKRRVRISHLITTVPGSSDYYLGSVTSYSPEIEKKLLGVQAATIETKGIVSSDVACAMAEGVRKLTGSTYSVATTGWADSYGDEHEPAGTVWVAGSGPDGTISSKFQKNGLRKDNIRAFTAYALKFLVGYITKETTD